MLNARRVSAGLLTSQAFVRLQNSMRIRHDLYLNIKVKMSKANILPILPCGVDLWTVYAKQAWKLDTSHLSCLHFRNLNRPEAANDQLQWTVTYTTSPAGARAIATTIYGFGVCRTEFDNAYSIALVLLKGSPSIGSDKLHS
nr:unnamed protein product [Spirometra erinaceieuropaei]